MARHSDLTTHLAAPSGNLHRPARWRLLGMLTAFLAVTVVADAGPLSNSLPQDINEERTYIVQLAGPPAVTRRGRSADGRKFDPQSADIRRYTKILLDRHDEILRSVGAYDKKLYSYSYTFNGFAARLTALQAEKIRSRKDVAKVWEDRVRYLQTNDSSVFLGLFDAETGLTAARNLKGEDVVIGIIDSGIAPEHPSFADTVSAEKPRLCNSSWAESSLLGLWLCYRFNNRDDQLVYEPPTGWNGVCETGDNFTADACNNKIIGARFYAEGFRQNYGEMDSNEFVSPRDADGHGTHIASTAAGTEVRATLAGREIDRIVGLAPRARIAVYKACWLQPGQIRGSCSTSDLQRAIEDAVADGVDIINYSVGNDDDSITDPDDLALLAASHAGVLSVVAAGNDGVENAILSTAGAPWVLTVGASSRTGNRYDDIVRVNSPNDVAGDFTAKEALFTPPLRDNGPVAGTLALVDDGQIVVDDNQLTDSTTYNACSPLLNAGAVAGKIAFMQRGDCDFEVKFAHAEAAGAIAALVFNHGGEFILMGGTRDSVGIPAVMIGQADGQRLLAALQDGDTVDVTLDKSLFRTVPEAGDVLADFSSRGPNFAVPDILKPDVIAPGVNILAGQTPDVANGIRDELFQYLSGTSMSTPQVAGLAALIKEAHPDWSPAAIKSALVTTGRQDIVKEDGETPADAFDIGGGHVVPNLATEPGLVYEAGKEDYEAFLCGQGENSFNKVIDDQTCGRLVESGYPTAASDLNQPSIAVSSLVNEKSVTRRVTNLGEPGQYTVQVEAPSGIDIEVDPSTLTLGTGDTGTYEVRLARTSAEPQVWKFGALNWVGPKQSVRSPVAVRPDLFSAPFEALGEGVSGNLSFPVEFGYTGAYTATFSGLSAPIIFAATVDGESDADRQDYVQIPIDGEMPDTIWRSPPGTIVVTESDRFIRLALFDENTSGDDDLDLYVYFCPTELFCNEPFVSGRFDSNEQVDIELQGAGEFIVDVHGYDTEAVSTDFDLYVWIVGEDQALGNPTMTAPLQAVAGNQNDISISWDGLETHDGSFELKAHLGTVAHDDGNPETIIEPAITVIEIQHEE